ncbi:hypothetical protein CH249_01735 [Rhodococcus sp. 05-2255-3B1]|uniref:hypothetical protein n=1 Tax=unclassified Rhodococcus (in: high G+C Gram-positive bacteria) TaxID=192944 RepID=UPI000B9B1193|nr:MULTISPECIES: hypothetical protein [unclassified Rhodococcus (in: high G+C Gram-positive bacteria)]OZE13394.1 hypothetical protein CH250_05630 [Rhodococcus sp. 05-2255-3C]OZE15993.1 hypothetical protein CH249_01735 [Rhodococcus sp. 05-2255-3B1]OZE19033.1 hypothetical protein CH255_13760 [Rhodococcus sp. 05-2255-2A2]
MSVAQFGKWDPLFGITAPGTYPMAYAREGVVEFSMPGEWSGRLTPHAAREWIDALHAAVHAAAGHAEAFDASGPSTSTFGTGVQEQPKEFVSLHSSMSR